MAKPIDAINAKADELAHRAVAFTGEDFAAARERIFLALLISAHNTAE